MSGNNPGGPSDWMPRDLAAEERLLRAIFEGDCELISDAETPEDVSPNLRDELEAEGIDVERLHREVKAILDDYEAKRGDPKP